jgi:hypothetical protein
MVKPSYSPDEIARLGDLVYDREVAPHAAPEDAASFVAIDVDSGAYEIAPDELSAIDRLRARKPDAQVWLRRVGAPYTHRFGGSRRRCQR